MLGFYSVIAKHTTIHHSEEICEEMNKELQKFVAEHPKLVRMRETSNPDLFVLKYQRSVFYDNLWDDHLEECRGTVVDKDFNLIL